MITKNEVIMLFEAGFTMPEIMDIANARTQAATQTDTQAATQVDTQTATQAAPDDVSNRDLLAAVTRLTNMMAMSNIRNTAISNPEPDVTAQLNSLFAAPPAQK